MTTVAAARKRLLKRSERQEINDITALATQLSMTVCSTQQFRPSKQAVGLPDLWIMDPSTPRAFWWECKTVNGIQSAEQQAFERVCRRSWVAYGIGTFADFCGYVTSYRGRMINPPDGCERWSGRKATSPVRGQPTPQPRT